MQYVFLCVYLLCNYIYKSRSVCLMSCTTRKIAHGIPEFCGGSIGFLKRTQFYGK